MIYKLNIDVFVLTDGFRAAVESAVGDRTLARCKITVMEGGLLAATEYYASNETPPLLILEEDADDETMMAHLSQLAGVCEPTTQVVVAGNLNDIGLYRTLMSKGISEYLVLPTTGKAIVGCVESIYAEPEAQPRGRIISVFGSRGGAGSSTVAANTAWALADVFKDDTVLVDLDINFGTADLSFNIQIKQPITDALSQPDRLDPSLLHKFLVPVNDRLSVFGAPSVLRNVKPLSIDSLDLVLDMVRLNAAFVVLDVPHGWASWVPQLLKGGGELILVSAPDLASLRDTKNLFEFLGEGRDVDSPIRLVLNRCGAYPKGELTAKDFEDTVGVAPVAEIAYDASLFLRALNNGQPAGEIDKGEKAAEAFRAIACKVAGRHAPAGAVAGATGHSGLMASLKGLLNNTKGR